MQGIYIEQLEGIKEKSKGANTAISERPIWQNEISFGPELKLKEKQAIFQMLSILLKAGLGIIECLDVLMEQRKDKKVLRILQEIRTDLEGGVPMSECLGKHPKAFSEFEIQSLRMGELTGQMPGILASLAHTYEKRIALKSKISQALAYPLAVIVVSLLVLVFMIAFVVPMFKDIFARFDAELPAITQSILFISEALSDHVGLIVLGIGVLGGIGIWLRKQAQVQKIFTQILLKVPLLGPLILKLQLSRWCYTFAMLLNSSVSADKALALMERMIRFYPLNEALIEIKKDIIDGLALSDACQKHKIFPAYVNQILRVGEKTAKTGEMLENLGNSLEKESEAGLKQLTQFLEPLLIIILGVAVALILIAMYLPMFELSNAIQ